MPEAAALGLAPPLPAGLSRALSDVGTKPAVGWAELKLTADERTDVLAKFQALDETPWPPVESGTVGSRGWSRTRSATRRSWAKAWLSRRLVD